MRGLQRLGNLLGDGQSFVEWDRPLFDAIGQRRAFDQLQDQRSELTVRSVFQPVEAPDVGMVQRGEDLGFPLEAGQPVTVGRERFGVAP